MFNNCFNRVMENLMQNNFEVYYAENVDEAKEIFTSEIYTKTKFASVSYADSITMQKVGVLEEIKKDEKVKFIETFDYSICREEIIKRRINALSVDLFLTGTNAVTENGSLVNLDMVGNRVGAITFGPKTVVLFVGKNKIVKNVDEAIERIKKVSSPLNAKRHTNYKLPCQYTGVCQDCNCPDRICNTWTITEKSYPAKRIKIILINEELGY